MLSPAYDLEPATHAAAQPVGKRRHKPGKQDQGAGAVDHASAGCGPRVLRDGDVVRVFNERGALILAHQIRTISKERLIRPLGPVKDPGLQSAIEEAMRIHLDLWDRSGLRLSRE